MSNRHHLTGNGSYPDSSHEKIIPLLDAFSTDELENDERKAVEQHLTICRECQRQLAIIRHFRGLFAKQANDHQHNGEEGVVLAAQNPQSSWLADSVLDEIAQNRGETMRQKPISDVLQEPQPTKRFPIRRKWHHSLPLIAAVFGVVLLVGALFVTFTYFHQVSTGPNSSTPPSLAWERYDGQFLAQSPEGTFSTKYMEITSQEFHFFYAFRSASHEIPKVTVFSYLPSSHATSIKLSSTVQSLGYLSGFNVGVVHASRLNRVGQIIELQITSSGKNTFTKRLTPLKQLLNNPSANWGFPIGQAEFPEVIWYGPVMMEKVAFFKSGGTRQLASHTSHIFVRLDDPVVVKVITQAEYLAIAGQQNFF